jgi:ribosomal protein S18 acetylase RimI-like enzyme
VRGGAAGWVFRVTNPRRATPDDIDQLIRIRGAVQENRLRDPASVTRADYDWFVKHGHIWLTEVGGEVAGFAAGDPRDGTIWALFVDPRFEGAGIGAILLANVCADLKAAGHSELRLSTDPATKAARLYGKLGWEEQGLLPDGEMAFRLVL